MIDISNALKIEGWMTPEELLWLATQASRCQSVIEVGSYCGRSTRALADNCPGIIYAIDTWAPGPWTKDIDWMTDELASQYERFRENMAPHISEGKVVPIREASSSAAPKFLMTGGYDLVFIDGAHDLASVRKDILAWNTLATGILCGHDYDHPGVRQAVTELVPNHENPVGTIWVRV